MSEQWLGRIVYPVSVQWSDLTSRIAELEQKLAEAQKDQARYQWVRQAGAWDSEVGLNIMSENPCEFDAAVDAAIQ